MAENRITQKHLGESIGVTPTTIKNKLVGRSDFTASEIAKMSKLFGVNPAIFFAHSFTLEQKSHDNTPDFD